MLVYKKSNLRKMKILMKATLVIYLLLEDTVMTIILQILRFNLIQMKIKQIKKQIKN